jgi:DNA-binding MarR family transcriptional regulator
MTRDLRPKGDPSSDAFDVGAYPFYLLNRTVSRYNVLIEAELRTIGIDIPTWRVLATLGDGGRMPIAEMAKTAVINLSTMTRILERMTKARLIASQPHEQRRRVTVIALTAIGRKKLAEARIITAPFYKKIIRNFSAKDFAKLIELINRLHDNLG